MKILLLGSRGFIGSRLVYFFLAKGYDVFGCDLQEYHSNEYIYQKVSILSTDFETLFTDQQFDACINTSGSGNVPLSISLPFSDFEANSYSVAKVLNTLRKFQPSCKYIQISSAAVYGNPEQLPISESALINPISPYGYHKWISELICHEYQTLYQIPIVIVRPFSVYGEGLRKQLFWDICSRLAVKDTIQISGTGLESRDFIHFHDLARLFDLIIHNSSFTGEIYNAATGLETSIRSVANLIEQNYGQRQILFSGETRIGDPLNWRADISKITKLGFKPVISLKEGIAGYIKWFENEHKTEE